MRNKDICEACKTKHPSEHDKCHYRDAWEEVGYNEDMKIFEKMDVILNLEIGKFESQEIKFEPQNINQCPFKLEHLLKEEKDVE